MVKRLTALIVGVIAVAVLSFAAVAADAETITISPGGRFTASARQTLTLDPGGLAVACDLSFAVSVTSTVITTSSLPSARVPIGSITGGSGGSCSGGATLTMLGMPWTLLFDVRRQLGVIPVGLMIFRNVLILLGIGAVSCLWAGDIKFSANFIQLWNASPTVLIPKFSGSFLCPDPLRISGDIAVSPGQTISIR